MSEPVRYLRALAGTQPEPLHPPYVSSRKRAPNKPLVYLPHTISEVTGPVFAPGVAKTDGFDLTRQHLDEPLGERIVVSARGWDEHNRPVPHTLIEVCQ